MNKLLIVGHPSAACGDIEDLLNQCGMATPLPSRKEGFSPQQIGSTILKASALDGDRDKSRARGDLNQLTPGPVWQGLVLDLMLGNIEQDFWGWSDPNAVHLLDYWKNLDPSIKFVLVYSDPREALEKGALDSREHNDAVLDQQLRDWCVVNSAILRFHNFNRDRSILVHADEALSSVHAYLQQLRTRLNAPLSEPPEAFLPQVVNGSSLTALDRDTEDDAELSACHDELKIDAAGEISSARALGGARHEDHLPVSRLSEYLDQQLLVEYPEVSRLYEELQSSANLSSEYKFDDAAGIREAWLELRELEQQTGRLQSMLDAMTVERDLKTIEDASRVQQSLAEYRLVQAEGEAKAVQYELQIGNLQTTINGLRISHEQLEELNADLQLKHDRVAAEAIKAVSDKNELAEKARLVQADMARLLKTNAELQDTVNIYRGEAARAQLGHDQLLDQLHAVQEELEKYYLEVKRLKDESVPPLYGAAERVKGQLAYRLGALMIQRSKSWGGRLGMLGALKEVQKDFKSAQLLELGLPPIASYRDADEGIRVTRHLSYRLGSAYLANTTSLVGWLKLPFALKHAIREFNVYKSAKN